MIYALIERNFRKWIYAVKNTCLYLPLLENNKYSSHEQSKTQQVIPGQFFFFEKNKRKARKDNQRDGFLNGFQLNQVKGTAVFVKASAVRRNLKKIFEKSKSPADQDHRK